MYLAQQSNSKVCHGSTLCKKLGAGPTSVQRFITKIGFSHQLFWWWLNDEIFLIFSKIQISSGLVIRWFPAFSILGIVMYLFICFRTLSGTIYPFTAASKEFTTRVKANPVGGWWIQMQPKEQQQMSETPLVVVWAKVPNIAVCIIMDTTFITGEGRILWSRPRGSSRNEKPHISSEGTLQAPLDLQSAQGKVSPQVLAKIPKLSWSNLTWALSPTLTSVTLPGLT